MDLSIQVHDKQTSATFFVIKGKGGSLIGQNTATAINLLCIGLPQEFVNHLSSVPVSTQTQTQVNISRYWKVKRYSTQVTH